MAFDQEARKDTESQVAPQGDGRVAKQTRTAKVTKASDTQAIAAYLAELQKRIDRGDREAAYQLYLFQNDLADTAEVRAAYEAGPKKQIDDQLQMQQLLRQLEKNFTNPPVANAAAKQLHELFPVLFSQEWLDDVLTKIRIATDRAVYVRRAIKNWSTNPGYARQALARLRELFPTDKKMLAWCASLQRKIADGERRRRLETDLKTTWDRRPSDAQGYAEELHRGWPRAYSAAWLRTMKDQIWGFQDQAWAARIDEQELRDWLGDNALDWEEAPAEVKREFQIQLGRLKVEQYYAEGGKGAKDTRQLAGPTSQASRELVLAQAAKVNKNPEWGGFSDGDELKVKKTELVAKNMFEAVEADQQRLKTLASQGKGPGDAEYDQLAAKVDAARTQAAALYTEAQRRKNDKTFDTAAYLQQLEQQREEAVTLVEAARKRKEEAEAKLRKSKQPGQTVKATQLPKLGGAERAEAFSNLNMEPVVAKATTELAYQQERLKQLEMAVDAERNGLTVPLSMIPPAQMPTVKVQQAEISRMLGIKPGTFVGDTVNATEWAIAAGATSGASVLARVIAGSIDWSVVGLADWGTRGLTNWLGLTSGPSALQNLSGGIKDWATTAGKISQLEMEASGGGLLPAFVKVGTEMLVLYLPTLGFGAAGATVARAMNVSEVLGSSVAMGGFGFLSTSGLDTQTRAMSTVMMALFPVIGAKSAGFSPANRVGTAFATNALPTMVMPLVASWPEIKAIYDKEGLDAALKAALAKVPWEEVVANGLLGVVQQEYSLRAGKTKQPSVAELNAKSTAPLIVGKGQVDGVMKEVVARVRLGADGAYELAEVPAGKRGAYEKFGTYEVPLEVLQGALKLRGDALQQALESNLSAEVTTRALDAKEADLTAKLGSSKTEGAQRQVLEQELANVQARRELTKLAAERQPLPRSLVDQVGEAPPGYFFDGTELRFDADLATRTDAVRQTRGTANRERAQQLLVARAELARARQALLVAGAKATPEQRLAVQRAEEALAVEKQAAAKPEQVEVAERALFERLAQLGAKPYGDVQAPVARVDTPVDATPTEVAPVAVEPTPKQVDATETPVKAPTERAEPSEIDASTLQLQELSAPGANNAGLYATTVEGRAAFVKVLKAADPNEVAITRVLGDLGVGPRLLGTTTIQGKPAIITEQLQGTIQIDRSTFQMGSQRYAMLTREQRLAIADQIEAMGPAIQGAGIEVGDLQFLYSPATNKVLVIDPGQFTMTPGKPSQFAAVELQTFAKNLRQQWKLDPPGTKPTTLEEPAPKLEGWPGNPKLDAAKNAEVIRRAALLEQIDAPLAAKYRSAIELSPRGGDDFWRTEVPKPVRDQVAQQLDADVEAAATQPTQAQPDADVPAPKLESRGAWWQYQENAQTLDPALLREAPTKLGEGSQSDVWSHKDKWVVKTLQAGGMYGELPPDVAAKITARTVELGERANQLLGGRVVPKSRALGPVPLEGQSSQRPVVVQQKVQGIDLAAYQGLDKPQLVAQARQMIETVSKGLNLPITEQAWRVDTLKTVDTWTVDGNLANFIVTSEGQLVWIDPVFPPSREMIEANPAILDTP